MREVLGRALRQADVFATALRESRSLTGSGTDRGSSLNGPPRLTPTYEEKVGPRTFVHARAGISISIRDHR